MGFNRYAYAYNNPLKYVDPDGHFAFLSFFIGAAIFTVGATSDNPTVHALGMLIGNLMMGHALSGLPPIEAGAIRGFTTSVLSGQDIGQIFRNTVMSGINAQITSGLPGLLN